MLTGPRSVLINCYRLRSWHKSNLSVHQVIALDCDGSPRLKNKNKQIKRQSASQAGRQAVSQSINPTPHLIKRSFFVPLTRTSQVMLALLSLRLTLSRCCIELHDGTFCGRYPFLLAVKTLRGGQGQNSFPKTVQ